LLAADWRGLLQHQLAWDNDLTGAIWLLLLLAIIAMIASMSQLAIHARADQSMLHDPLTGCYNRGSGEQFMELQFSIAARQQAPLALSFSISMTSKASTTVRS